MPLVDSPPPPPQSTSDFRCLFPNKNDDNRLSSSTNRCQNSAFKFSENCTIICGTAVSHQLIYLENREFDLLIIKMQNFLN